MSDTTSFAEKYKTHAFHDLIEEAEKQGIALGVQREKERIIQLLDENWVEPMDWLTVEALIKGE